MAVAPAHPRPLLHCAMRVNRCLALRLVAGSLLLAGCDTAAPAADEAVPSEVAASPRDAAAQPASANARKDGTLHPATIYYDLTRFDWYARGEPLRHGNADYVARAAPVRASAADMRRAGEYQGVEYYRAAADDVEPAGVVYVPVFEGFWLPFSADTSTAAAR